MAGQLLHALEKASPAAKKAFDRALLVVDTPDLGKILQQVLIVGNLIVRPLFAVLDTAVSVSQRAFTASWMGLREGTNMVLAESVFPPVQKGAFWLARQIFQPEELANFKTFATIAKQEPYKGLAFDHADIKTMKRFNGLAKVHLNAMARQVEKELYRLADTSAQATGEPPLKAEQLLRVMQPLIANAYETRKNAIAGNAKQLWAFFPHMANGNILADSIIRRHEKMVPAVAEQIGNQLERYLSKKEKSALQQHVIDILTPHKNSPLPELIAKANEVMLKNPLPFLHKVPASVNKTISDPKDLAQLGAQLVEDGLSSQGQLQFSPALEGLFAAANITASLTALGVISPQLSNVMVTPFLKILKKVTGRKFSNEPANAYPNSAVNSSTPVKELVSATNGNGFPQTINPAYPAKFNALRTSANTNNAIALNRMADVAVNPVTPTSTIYYRGLATYTPSLYK